MKKTILFAAGFACTVVLASCGNNTAETDSKKEADSANTAKIDSAKKADTSAATSNAMADMKPDANFAVDVADIGALEIQLGKLAQEKGVSAKVKQLGAMMVKDHTKAADELKAAAKQKNITLPNGLSDKAQQKVNDLNAKSGADFDKAYADAMVDGHKDTIDKFKHEIDKGTDAELVAWAKKTLPTLEHHLSMAEDTKKAVHK